ncbi:MAG: hypothetical protein RJA52_1383 [Bacteroidota bacterium]
MKTLIRILSIALLSGIFIAVSGGELKAQGACSNNFIVPLDHDCRGQVNPQIALFGVDLTNFTNTYGQTRVLVSLTPPLPVLDTVYEEDSYFSGVNSNWMYGVYTLQSNGNWNLYCWGRFVAEDKIDPRFVGDKTPTYETQGFEDYDPRDSTNFMQYGTYKLVEYATWSDSLNAGSDATFYPHQWTCWQSTNHPDSAITWPGSFEREFDTLKFKATQSGLLTIFASSYLNTGTASPAFEPVVAVYGKGGFSSANPCQHLIGLGQSSFIPNPLAGLGFLNYSSGGSLPNTVSDTGEIFAPWLLHNSPIVRLDVKIEADQEYTVLMTHRGNMTNPGYFNLYFLLNQYESTNVGTSIIHHLVSSDSLGVDSSYSYFDFLCGDLNSVRLNAQVTLDQTRYTGGTLAQMAGYLNTDTILSRVDSAWYALGYGLLSRHGSRDTSFVDLGYYNISENLMDTLLYHHGFMPLVIENCGQWSVTINDSYRAIGECGLDIGGFNGLTQGYNVAGILTRTYVVTDHKNKTDEDTARVQLIFRNPTLYDIRLPHYTVNVECNQLGEEVTLLSNGNPSPVSTGYPFIPTLNGFVDLKENNSYCNLAASYADRAEVTNCSSNKSFRREWTVYDWCRPGTTIIYHQLINIGDFTAPVFLAGTTTTTTNFGSGLDCKGGVTISKGTANDVCAGVKMSIRVSTNSGQEVVVFENVSTPNVVVNNLNQGMYLVEWTATDDCGNFSKTSSTFQIRDNISPSCVIDDIRTISLTDFGNGSTSVPNLEKGEAYLPVSRLDQGSKDNCYPVVVHARRETETGFTAWGDLVKFNCQDAGDSIKVEMIARELLPDATFGDSTKCWVYIRVEDKSRPICRDVPTREFFCDDIPSGNISDTSSVWNQFFNDSIQLSKVLVTGLCMPQLKDVSTEVKIDQCGFGYVTRYYEVYNNSGQFYLGDTCRSTIIFEEKHDYWFKVPEDKSVECAEITADSVTISENACDLLVISKSDERFTATSDECYKIFRTYRIINWCEYDGVSSSVKLPRLDVNGDGNTGDVYAVMAKGSINYEGYIVTNRYDFLPATRDTLDANPDNNSPVVSWRNPLAGASQTSAESVDIPSPTGFFEYTQILKVFDRVAPSISVITTDLVFESFSNNTDNGCAAPVTVRATMSDATCTLDSSQLVLREVLLDIDSNGIFEMSTRVPNGLYTASYDTAVITITSPEMPIGKYVFRIVVSDGCGNVKTQDVPFRVIDAKAPAPICIEGFAVELMPTGVSKQGMATVNARDYVVVSPIEDCTGDTEEYTIIKIENLTPQQIIAADASTQLILTCNDAAKGGNDTIQVAIIATDNAGNKDYCVTSIVVQDNVQNLCDPLSIVIQGLIATEEDQMIKEVDISVNSSQSGMMDNMAKTYQDGSYSITGLQSGGDYTITAEKSGSLVDGISTLDIIMITKHILGVQRLGSPYKLIAADINRSSSITTLDVILLRKIILGIDQTIPGGKIWRFIPNAHQFIQPENPWSNPFNEFININNLNGEMINQDFVAIKMGDVNNSATQDILPRSNDKFNLYADDEFLKAGSQHTILFKGKRSDIEGYQFALKMDDLELVEIQEGLATQENFGLKYAQEGIVLTSWNGFGAEGVLFGMVVKAKKDIQISKTLEITGKYLTPEAYSKTGDAMDVGVVFENKPTENFEHTLKQNTPNPFREQTLIEFSLPEAAKATLTFSDITGRVLKVIKGDYSKGLNQVGISAKELSHSGIVLYTMTSGEYTETKRMMILH